MAACKFGHQRDLRSGAPFVWLCVFGLLLQVICAAVLFYSGLQDELGDHHGLTAGAPSRDSCVGCWAYPQLLIDQVRRRTKELVYNEVLA